MTEWLAFLKADTMDWLLEKEDPSVRALTLTGLLDRPAGDPEVAASRREIMRTGIVPKLLAGQSPEGYWEAPDVFYTAKYKGTVWQLIILAELGADGRDQRIRKACEFILEASQDEEAGGFSFQRRSIRRGGRPSGVIPCLTGNMVWSLIRLGLANDPRVKRGIDWICRYQRFDDGIRRQAPGLPYDRWPQCFGKHSCHMGVVKALKALAAVPGKSRTPAVEKTTRDGVDYLLKHHIHKRSHDLGTVSKPGWLRLGFPWMYQSDILEVLGILGRLGVRDPRMRDALDVLLSKQDERGRWTLEQSFNGRFRANIERKGFPSKWVTVHALTALKAYFGRAGSDDRMGRT